MPFVFTQLDENRRKLLTVSTDYESDSVQMLRDIQEELSPLIDGDTIIKTAHIDVSYQKSEPGLVWGNYIKDKNFTIKNDYPVTTVNNLIDTEIIAQLKKNSKISDVTHEACCISLRENKILIKEKAWVYATR